jgi:hypothetical protein
LGAIGIIVIHNAADQDNEVDLRLGDPNDPTKYDPAFLHGVDPNGAPITISIPLALNPSVFLGCPRSQQKRPAGDSAVRHCSISAYGEISMASRSYDLPQRSCWPKGEFVLLRNVANWVCTQLRLALNRTSGCTLDNDPPQQMVVT